MSPRDWLVKLREEKPFFFKQTGGGGAGGGATTKTGVHGLSLPDLKKLSAVERLALANKKTPGLGS
jgi:hypothetical protein